MRMKYRLGGGMEFLQTQEEKEKQLLELWESGTPAQRKQFERDLEADDSESFYHFRDNVLVNHLNMYLMNS